MKINLTPSGPGAAWEVEFTHGIAPFDEESPRLGGQEVHSIEFDGIVRTVKDFRAYVRSAARSAQVRHDEMLRATNAHKKAEEELQRLRERNRDLETRLLEAHEERKLLKIALEDSRNHGRYVLANDPQPLQDPIAKITVFGMAYEEAYKRVRGYEQVAIDKEAATEALGSERRRNAELKNQLEYQVGRTDERVREIRQLQEALRQKNEIIKSIREKVAEARIYE